MMNGKKLLLTGGSNFAQEIREFADKHGIILAATGSGGLTPLKKVADEVYDVDTRDEISLIDLIKKNKIDGIFAGGNEPNIITAIKVSNCLGLPYYCTLEQWEQLMDKSNFKALCKQYEIPVTPEIMIGEGDTVEIPDDIEFPVVVKPVDSCGSNGVLYCETKEELHLGIIEALKYSASKKVIVEQYVIGDEISATYTICHGNITLSCMKEKYPVSEQTGLMNMPNVFVYPSKHLDRYVKEVNDKVIAMLKSLNLTYGTLFIQGFVNTSEIYIFEAGFRPGGTNDFRYTDMMNGVNQMHMLIEQALTGDVQDDPNSRDNPYFKQICCSFTMCARGGTVGKIIGLEKLKEIKQIKTVEQFYHVGDEIPYSKTLAQRMLRYFILADSIQETESVINQIQNSVSVYDLSGNSILYSNFDTKRLY